MSPSAIFLFIFIIASFLFGIFSFFILYHLIRFGIGTRPKQAAFVFFCGSFVLFILLTISYFSIDVASIVKNNPNYQLMQKNLK